MTRLHMIRQSAYKPTIILSARQGISDHVMKKIAFADNHTSILFHENFGFHNDGQFTAADGDRLVAFSLQLDGFPLAGKE